MLLERAEGGARWVGRLERGDRLPDALVRLAREHGITAAWLSAIGAFERVEFCEYDQEEQTYQPALAVGQCEVLSLQGNVSIKDGKPFVHLHAVVSQEVSGTVVVTGGHLNEAQVFALEFRIDAYEGVELVRGRDPATGLHLWTDGEVSAEPRAPAGVTWEMAAEVSQQAGGEEPKAHEICRGDWLQHPKFGLCRVDAIQGDVMVIKLPDARRKKIKASFLEVSAPERQGNRIVYPVRPPRK